MSGFWEHPGGAGGRMRAALAGAALISLAACGGDSGQSFREQVGLDAPPPDETLVVARRPLELPSDMTALPPPRLGAPSRVEPNPTAEAQAALTGAPAGSGRPAGSAGEAALVAAAGAAAADPAIRETLTAEANAPSERRFGLDSFLGYEINQNPDAEAESVAAREEAERLRREGVQTPTPPPAAQP